MPETTDLLGFAIDKNPVDFADAFNQLVQQKSMAALENKRIELAQSIYGSPEDEDVGEDEFEFDEDDVEDVDADEEEFADDDLEDIDFDDLDLDDIDLDNLDDLDSDSGDIDDQDA